MTAPYLLHFIIFGLFPLVFSFILVFHHWNIVTSMRWAGIKNLQRVTYDIQFYKAVWNTFIFITINIPLQIIIGLILAVFLNEKIKMRGLFRAMYFMPVVVSGVVITILWQQMYSYESGLLNLILDSFHLRKIPWLIDPRWAMPSIAFMATWKNVGLYIVLFLVGLQAVPRELYEVADLDGATSFKKFIYITIPALNTTMVLVVLLLTMGGFSLFIEPFVMTGGGPMNSTLSAMLYIYNQAFYFGHMGYAAALGFIFALFIFIVILIQRKLIEEKD